MASNREEAYEVNLGNKQLLALFFIVTGFFALFFCAGYLIGFGHGEKTPGVVQVAEPEPEPPEPRLPATLRQDPPAPPPPVTAATRPKPQPKSAPPPVQKPKPAPKRTAPEKPSPTTAPAPKPAEERPQPAAASAGGYYLQVAAVRVEADAAQLAGKLKSKGYPAAVNSAKGDGWQRVVVGPFSSPEAAQSFKSKLGKDGFDTMLRKL